MTNQAGATVWRADYEPFGKATVTTNTVENNLRLPGQYYDRETNLHYNYYRSAYNPETGRYEEADPIGIEGGINVYGYANQNPLQFTDPLGLKWDDPGNSSVYPPGYNCQCAINCRNGPTPAEVATTCGIITARIPFPIDYAVGSLICEPIVKSSYCEKKCEKECNQCRD